MEHTVLISSMSVTQIDHSLNQHLNDICCGSCWVKTWCVAAALPYTIMHPGGIKDNADSELGIRFGQSDNLGRGTINCADVALTAVKALFINPAAFTALIADASIELAVRPLFFNTIFIPKKQ
ncbi:hypothetical protein [Nitrosomonas mobilis]|uniref:hypothetical protein n=1 Tax=Nitrosomonas mobilis TaxID=51642 RepID=UPI003CCBA6C0